MTFAELQTEVFRRLDEDSSDPTFWSLADVKEALNDGYEEISDASEWYETDSPIDLVASQVYYDLTSVLGSNTILSPKGIFNTTTEQWLDFTTDRDMDAEMLQWEIVDGEPQKCLLRGLWWLGLFPRPDSATPRAVRVYYSALPAPLVDGGDLPGFPEEFQYGLVHFAVGDLLAAERSTEKALGHFAEYGGYAARLTKYVQGRIAVDRITRLHG